MAYQYLADSNQLEQDNYRAGLSGEPSKCS
jgi:hypothetical protein